ncbi:uncharacterized protein E6C27_scaffold34G002290 [Cucumis melo var. makuwa]|uniref:Uncharacterized protein n=1 Tax=Cucumis melo var. makuwa TaxID=1194695 RepID=A0A5A7SIC6_CUCMM|nr:uncharacterized protein E6C27_scaffold34G002290 [Cucumis melo var. makuwa]
MTAERGTYDDESERFKSVLLGCVGWRTEEKEVGEGGDWTEEERTIEGRDDRQSTGRVRQRGVSEMGRLRTVVRWRCEADDNGDGETTTETETDAAVCRNEEKWSSEERGVILHGDTVESYALIPRFFDKLVESNPGTGTALEMDDSGHFKF